MTSFGLKIIALITMLCDHLGYILFHRISFMNIIGKLSFPIFAFQISEGYVHTKNLKKYIFRLFTFGIISQIPFMLFLSCLGTMHFTLNIFFTLLLGLLAITIFDQCKNKIIGWFSVIVIIFVSQLTHCDYGWFGPLIIFLFYFFKDNKLYMNISFILAVTIKYGFSYITNSSIMQIYLGIATCLSLLFINLYNHQKGKNIKYLLYVFYPLHLLFLYILSFFFVNLL